MHCIYFLKTYFAPCLLTRICITAILNMHYRYLILAWNGCQKWKGEFGKGFRQILPQRAGEGTCKRSRVECEAFSDHSAVQAYRHPF